MKQTIIISLFILMYNGGVQASDLDALDLRANCEAVGDGRHDDGGALRICLERLQSHMDQGHPAVLRIPAGIYRIGQAAGRLPTLTGSAAIIGDGPHQSHMVLDRSFVGDLFSWSKSWSGRNIGPPSYNVSMDKTGAEIIGLQVTGDIEAPEEQRAFVFYDRNDSIIMRDIEVDYLNGSCLSIGRKKFLPEAYLRESAFYNIKCFNTGTLNQPAVDIQSTTEMNSDATNELDFFKLAVYGSPGTGVSVRNPFNASATRKIRFFGLRVEDSGHDCLSIGMNGDKGVVAELSIYDFTAINCKEAGLHISRFPFGSQPYQIYIIGGSIGPGSGRSVVIEAGWNVQVTVGHVDTEVNFPENAAKNRIVVKHDGL